MASTQHRTIAIGKGISGTPWSYDDQTHDCHEFVLILEGRMETAMEGRTEVTGPGMAKFHPQGATHSERALDGRSVTLLCVAWASAPGTEYQGWPRYVADRSGRIRMLLEWMIELTPPHDDWSSSARDGLLQALTLAFIASGRTRDDDLVLDVRGWIRGHLADRICLDDLARCAGLSRYHFTRRFRQAAGMPPMHFVRTMRVDAVRQLLHTTRLTLREIAPQVGLGDEHQLSRVFRQVAGHAPIGARRRR